MRSAPFRSIETTDCPCRKFIASVDERRAKGQIFFGRARLTSVTPDKDTDELVEVLVSYDAGPSGVKDASGRVISQSRPRTAVTGLFYVRKIDSQWLIENIVSIRKGDLA
jgi:hypothetical protein